MIISGECPGDKHLSMKVVKVALKGKTANCPWNIVFES